MLNNIELMSPVGSFESLMAAIQGGASLRLLWNRPIKYALKIFS